jgi:hypothetical protein
LGKRYVGWAGPGVHNVFSESGGFEIIRFQLVVGNNIPAKP